MAVFPCDNEVTCLPCPDGNPLGNFSAEAPDPADFFADSYYAARPPLNQPPSLFVNPVGYGVCFAVDAQTAGDCALHDAQINAWRTWGVNNPTYGNAVQSCTVPCPDGVDSPPYTVPANTFFAHSQAEANALAASYCKNRAFRARVCLPIAVTLDATDLASTTATLNGAVNPNNNDTYVYFEWGTTIAYGNVTAIQVVAAGVVSQLASQALTGLVAGTTYHFRIHAINPEGSAVGADATFTFASLTLDFIPLDRVYDLASDGTVAGRSNTGTLAGTYKNGVTTLLANLPGTTASECFACNASGVSASYNTVAGSDHATWISGATIRDVLGPSDPLIRCMNAAGYFLMSNTGQMYNPVSNTIVVPPTTMRYTSSYKQINNSNQAVGRGLGTARFIFRWDGAASQVQVQPLTTVLGSTSEARGINASGALIGVYRDTVLGFNQGFFNPSGGVQADSINLGVLEVGSYCTPTGINDSNMVCANAGLAGVNMACRWTQGGGLVALPVIPGTELLDGFAYGINASGDITGIMGSKVFLYRASDGITYDLTALIPADGNVWVLTTATLINDSRQIVGRCTKNAVAGAYIMQIP